MKKLKEYYWTIIIIMVVVLVNIGAFMAYTNNVRTSLNDQTNSHINSLLGEETEFINLKLEEQVYFIEALARFIASIHNESFSREQIEAVIENQWIKAGYSIMDLVDSDGRGNFTDGIYDEEEWFKDAMEGKVTMQSREADGSVQEIVFSAPVYNADESKVIAVLMAEMPIENFTEAIQISSLDQNGKVFVVMKDGTFLSKTESLKDVNNIGGILPEKKYVDSLISGMRSRNSGIILYENDNVTRYIGYSRLSFNKWYVVSIISSEAVKASVSDMESNVLILGAELGFMLLVMVIYLIYNIVKLRNREKVNLERYFIATKYADTIMMDYSILKDTMYCNEKWRKIFGYTLPRRDIKQCIREHILEEDWHILEENYNMLLQDNKDVEFGIRILDSDGKPQGCEVKMFPICAKKGKIIKILCLIEREEA